MLTVLVAVAELLLNVAFAGARHGSSLIATAKFLSIDFADILTNDSWSPGWRVDDMTQERCVARLGMSNGECSFDEESAGDDRQYPCGSRIMALQSGPAAPLAGGEARRALAL